MLFCRDQVPQRAESVAEQKGKRKKEIDEKKGFGHPCEARQIRGTFPYPCLELPGKKKKEGESMGGKGEDSPSPRR